MRFRRPVILAGLALLLCLLNAPKPLHIDDTAYYYFARQIAAKPLDPYGFDLFWYQNPEDAQSILAPLVVPGWWALGLRLFGDHVFLWKMWLLPFALVLVFALAALFRRFARGLELPLVVMTVFSPAILPSFNLMLDVPALALGLAAVALFLRAWDRQSLSLAVAAGLTAGLAMQTKYTGVLACAAIGLAMALYGLIRPVMQQIWLSRLDRQPLAIPYRRILLGLVTLGVAGAVFVGWEWWLFHRYGESHFLYHLKNSGAEWKVKKQFPMPLITILGGVAPVLLVLGWAGFWPRRAVGAKGWAVAAAFWGVALVLVVAALGRAVGAKGWAVAAAFWGVALVLVVAAFGLIAALPPIVFTTDPSGEHERLTLNNAIFGGLGFYLLFTLGAVAWRRLSGRWAFPAADWLLLLWLLAEMAASVVLSPFTAVRRILGVVVVATLLAGRLASRSQRSAAGRGLVWGLALVNVALALLFYAVDFREAQTSKDGAEAAARWIQEQPPAPGATVWYAGHWGFQFYAERAGMTPVNPEYTWLREGDWLVRPDYHIHQQLFYLDDLEMVHELSFEDPLPLRTVICYYSGSTAVEHRDGPRLVVSIYRVRRAHYARY